MTGGTHLQLVAGGTIAAGVAAGLAGIAPVTIVVDLGAVVGIALYLGPPAGRDRAPKKSRDNSGGIDVG